MKKYTLEEAGKMLYNKKGAGVAKKSIIHIEFDIELKSGKPGVEMLVTQLPPILQTLLNHQSENTGYSREVISFTDKSYVQTEHEANPDWKQ